MSDTTEAQVVETKQESAATVPSYRLREETDRRSKAENDVKAAREALSTLTAQYEELQKSTESMKSMHSQDLALFGAGVVDGEVRELVRSRFGKREEKDVTFQEWLAKEQESPSAILAPFLRAKVEAVPEVETAPAVEAPPKAPNPNAGTGQPNSHQNKAWSTEELAHVRKKNRGRFGSDKESILATLRAEGLIK